VLPSPLLDAVPRLTAAAAGGAGALVHRCLSEDGDLLRRAALVEHYLGDTSDGAALKAFLHACGGAIAARDAEQLRLTGTPR
jgi:hypothetical protein